ncbi:MAG: HAD family phosphatase [Ruminococcaceae bacterium]|nr:HAD family phosphatase [Oscillospiraceae bacterium]
MVYLFDFDGTLVDSMPNFARVMTGILDANGIAYGRDIIKIITPLGNEGIADYYIGLGVKRTKQELLEQMDREAVEAYTYTIPAKNNVISVLKQLKERGDSLNVLTASPHPLLDPCLKRLGIFEWFDHVWACEDFGTNKADPEIYRMAAARMGVKTEEVLFLDDNYNADKTAKTAGMRVCGVYDASSAEYEEEIKRISDYYIHDFSELPAI